MCWCFVFVLIDPRTCRDIGILSCCDEAIAGSGNCDVYISDTEQCSCSLTCHERNDCCSDAESIGCRRKLLHNYNEDNAI